MKAVERERMLTMWLGVLVPFQKETGGGERKELPAEKDEYFRVMNALFQNRKAEGGRKGEK